MIKPDIKTIFLIPPNLDVLLARMQSERLLDPSEVARRLTAARKEIAYAVEEDDYFCLISDTVEHVVARSHAFLQDNQRNEEDDRAARRIMTGMLEQLKEN